MDMKTLPLILVLLFTPFCNANPLLADSEAVPAAKTLEMPLPTRLKSGWWDYFDNIDEDAEVRDAEKTYRQMLEGLPEASVQQARKDIRRFFLNLGIYNRQKKAGKETETIKEPLHQDSYSIAEWLDAAMQQNTQKILLEQQQLQVEQASFSVKSAQKAQDRLMLEYLETNIADARKITLGFKLMADRSAIALQRLQLKSGKAELLHQQQRLQWQQELVRQALEKLRPDPKLARKRQQRHKKLQEMQQDIAVKLQKKLTQNMELAPDDMLSKTHLQVEKQHIINLRLEESDIALQLASLDAHEELAALLQQQVPDLKKLGDRVQEWREQQTSILSNITLWENKTLQQAEQARSLMVSLSADPQSSAQIKQLLQEQLDLALDAQLRLKKIRTDKQMQAILLDELDNRISRQSGHLDHFFNWSSLQLEDVADNLKDWWKMPLFNIGDTPLTAKGLSSAVLIVVIAWLCSLLLRRFLQHLAQKEHDEKFDSSGLYTIGRLSHYVILATGLMVALSSIGLDFSNLALVAGALSVGIGFGLQSIVNNFVSGLILLFERSLKVGDFIELDSGLMGVIKEINVRSTLVNTTDNIDIIVPNSLLVSEKVTNWTLREAIRRIHVPFGVAYGSDKELVKKAVLEAASRVPFTHQLKKGDSIQCWLTGFGDSSLDFELVVWVNKEAVRRPSTVHAAYTWEIETSLNQYGIEIPFPQRDLHIRSLP